MVNSKVRLGYRGALGVVVLLGAGCGGDGGDASDAGSGVSGKKGLLETTEAERKTLCDWLKEESGKVTTEDVCTSDAESMSSPAVCEQSVMVCVQVFEALNFMEDFDPQDWLGADSEQTCEESFADLSANCSATVDEWEACYRDTIEPIAEASCANAGKSDQNQQSQQSSRPASCTRLYNICPDAAGEWSHSDSDVDGGW